MGLSGKRLSSGSSYGKSIEGSGPQTLPNDDVGLGQIWDPDFWWIAKPGNRQLPDTHDLLLGWNSDGTGMWSNLAYIDGNDTRLIVGVDRQKDPCFTQVGELAAKHSGRVADTIRMKQEVTALVIELPLTSARTFAVNALGLSSVRYVEPNIRVQAEYTPNDANWSLQWGPRIIQADWAWNTTKGSSTVLVAVIDTGIDYTHPDIAPNYIPSGYDWVNNDTDPMDDNGHGTHCAGIIAAVTNNSVGIAGIAQVHVMAEKVLDDSGWGYWDWLAKGIINATDCGANIISMSLGGYYRSELVHDAVRYAYSRGVLLIAAAGNDNTNETLYPAGYDEVVAVSATEWDDTKAWFSNWGEWIELAAPGVNIYSTVPGGYENESGTSMACPHVSGVAALAWSKYQDKSRDWIRMWLRYTADDLGDPGFDPYYGYGRVDARNAVERTVPDHDIALLNLENPEYAEPGVSQYINATVINLGATDENNIEIQFIVNGSLTDTREVSFLANRTSTEVSFEWTPMALGECNITIYAEPVPSEDIITDNGIAGWTNVRHPLIRPIPGQWATYTITLRMGSEKSTGYMNITYDHYVKPYSIYITLRLLMYGNVSVYGITVNTWDRRVEGDILSYELEMLWFYGWIETNITMGSTVNLVQGTATVEESKYLYYGIYPIECWRLRYYDLLGHEDDLYYDKVSGLLIARNYTKHGGSHFDWRLNDTNIMKPSYEHELAVAFDAPLYLARGNSLLLNATVFNIGSSTENEVVLSLALGGSETKRVIIPALENGKSYTTSYLWTPTLEATYELSASVEPVVNETYLGNNVVTRSVTVSHPLINPVEGQYANYSVPFANFTYLRYISPYQINVTFSTPYDVGSVHNWWLVVNTFTRVVEDASDYYFGWVGGLFLNWIETNITLGSTIRIQCRNGTVVGNQVIHVDGRFIDCWEIQMGAPYTENYWGIFYWDTYGDTLWYDKASGMLLKLAEYFVFPPPFGLTTRVKLLETSVPLGFGYNNEITATIETGGRPVVGGNIILNATVYNTGRNAQLNIRLQLMIDGATVDQVSINYLPSGWSYSLNYTWVPTRIRSYNISVYVHPVPGENYVANNVASRLLEVYSQYYKRVYIDHQWIGDEDHNLNDYWQLAFSFPFYGQNQYLGSYDLGALRTGLITFQRIGYLADNIIDPNDRLAAILAIAPAWGTWLYYYRNTISWNKPDPNSPNEFHILWQLTASSNMSISATFEAILGADGKIQFNYGSCNGPVSATIGISNGVGSILAEDATHLNYSRSIVFIPDQTSPAAITDLGISGFTDNTITLTWTAPGDDGLSGNATGYIVKYSTIGPIDDSNWESATTYKQSWIPLPANCREVHVISGLSPNVRYWFAIKACDAVPNYSRISNSPGGRTSLPVAVRLAVTAIALAVPTVLITLALVMDARAGAAAARRRALRLRRRRATIRRRTRQ